ncbi:MAG: hypothetical protein AB7O62_06245 [Pirellulales bacterium]
MDKKLCGWRDVAFPVLLSAVSFSVANALWNHPQLKLWEVVRPSIPTYLIGGSGVALVLLWLAARRGVLTSKNVGLDLSGWSAPRRLAGVGMILLMGLGGYLSLPAPPAQPGAATAADADLNAQSPSQPLAAATHPKPSWGDYCFWFVHLLSASLAELLVFCCLMFCLLERWLRSRGMGAFVAWLVAAVVASVGFGLYHYTHEPRWYGYVYFPLMPVMMMNLAYFGLSRNFYLTLMLHNSFAAVGFTQEQYATYPPHRDVDPATYLAPQELWPLLVSFIVPFLALHALEYWGFGRNGEQVSGGK